MTFICGLWYLHFIEHVKKCFDIQFLIELIIKESGIKLQMG
jgi:hypothetical protein